jgi:hypothetical protein
MAVKEDAGVTRIGRLDMTIKRVDGEANPRTRREERIEALAAWLFSEWKRTHSEGGQ